MWPIKAFSSSYVDHSDPSAQTPTVPLRAHPALPLSQQRRINAWIAAMPTGFWVADNMPDLIELARHMDRAERISQQIHATLDIDMCASNSLTHFLAAEEARIQVLSQRLKIPATEQ